MKNTTTEFFNLLEQKETAAAQPSLATRRFAPGRAKMTRRLWLLAFAAVAFLAVDATAQLIDTLAGTGVQGFTVADGLPAIQPLTGVFGGMAYDAQGRLYFIESPDSPRIRRIENGTVTTVVGTGGTGYSPDGTLATNAGLNRPSDVAFDQNGTLFFVDGYNHLVRRVDGLGQIQTVAGIYGVTNDQDGIPATQASLLYPYAIAFDSFGDLYVADRNHARIRKIKLTAGIGQGNISTVIGRPPRLDLEEA